jgi:hypothetical protein
MFTSFKGVRQNAAIAFLELVSSHLIALKERRAAAVVNSIVAGVMRSLRKF